jgi:predicted PurR-regulated permease PerM
LEPNSSSADRGFGFLHRIRWRRIAFWGIFLGLLYVLRDFFDVIFLTFLFSYIFGHLVSWLLRLAGKEASPGFRKGFVLGLYVVLVGGLGLGLYVAYPHLLKQGKALLDRVGAWQRPTPAQPAEDDSFIEPAEQAETHSEPWTKERVEALLAQMLGKEGFASFQTSAIFKATRALVKNLLNSVLPGMTERLGGFFRNFLRWALHLFLALIFSLLILFDLPRLQAQFRSLERSQMGDFYREIAPSLEAFGAILGKAFQAQAVIAIANTVLTAIGIFILGIPHPFLLSGIVFVCSFIPVLGVFISTVPMALFAVQAGGGMQVLYIVLWVLGVHAIEAYVLNPKILGNFMHMHALLVLIILVVAEHLFGMWGLLLGVPVCFFLYHHFVKGDAQEVARTPLRRKRTRAPQKASAEA